MPQTTHHDLKSKTISGFFWRMLERICAQAVTFVVTVVLARILMPQEFGLIAIVNVFVALVTGVFVLACELTAARESKMTILAASTAVNTKPSDTTLKNLLKKRFVLK